MGKIERDHNSEVYFEKMIERNCSAKSFFDEQETKPKVQKIVSRSDHSNKEEIVLIDHVKVYYSSYF